MFPDQETDERGSFHINNNKYKSIIECLFNIEAFLLNISVNNAI